MAENTTTSKRKTNQSNAATSNASQSVSKRTPVTILMSVFRFDNKVVSACGVPDDTLSVSHRIGRKSITNSGWFDIMRELNKGTHFNKDVTKNLVNEILSESSIIHFPMIAKPLNKLTHSIDTIEVEL